jgi:hypothetical protein
MIIDEIKNNGRMIKGERNLEILLFLFNFFVLGGEFERGAASIWQRTQSIVASSSRGRGQYRNKKQGK